ncbi:TetR/AcrR family transcriptional regulator [Paenibacillus popilliae]|uniref:Transcriptional regulator n=1 Tax=Paenibacillus popilliae ATCC 14706 TaxID=1212764 RepID=M9LAB3_PAEPP|nr:TetR-like C-terminal domain-containing protein [Paenibacillus popilliae]GAC42542.1 transcriptional regulator [Paenibacillus popilliae ATCC 14706]
MKKKPEITALTRERLMNSFWKLYCKKQINKISIKEITDNAGYYRSTFYEYFTDIYDVLNQLETELILYLKENVYNSLGTNLSEDIIKSLANIYESKGEYLSVLLGENGDPTFNQKLKDIFRNMLFENFGLDETDIHAQFIFEFAISAILSSIKHWYDNGKQIPAKEMVVLLRSTLMNGAGNQILKYSNIELHDLPFNP